MKRLLSIILLLGLFIACGYSQEEPIPPKRSRAVKVGLFGGFTPGWLSIDVAPINAFLTAGKGAALKDNGVFMTGGAGAAYIMVLPNVRVGGMGLTGVLKSTSLDGSNIRRDANLRVGFGGVTIEYVLPVVERLDISVGAMLGAGGMDLTLRQSNGGNNTWVGEQDLFGKWPDGPASTLYTTPNITRTLSSMCFVWVPAVNIEYSVLGWLGVRLGASYVGMSFPSWDVDGEYELLGVPSDVSGRGFMVQAGIFVGTF
jgi:hypothetical protein